MHSGCNYTSKHVRPILGRNLYRLFYFVFDYQYVHSRPATTERHKFLGRPQATSVTSGKGSHPGKHSHWYPNHSIITGLDGNGILPLLAFSFWISSWKVISNACCLYESPASRFYLVTYVLKRIAFAIEAFTFQYASEWFSWPLNETTSPFALMSQHIYWNSGLPPIEPTWTWYEENPSCSWSHSSHLEY